MSLSKILTTAVTACVALALTSCATSTDEGVTASPALTPTASVRPTPTPTTMSRADQAIQQVKDLLRNYYYPAQIDCYADPSRTADTCFDRAAVGSERADLTNGLVAARFAKTKTSGSIDVMWIKPVDIDLVGQPKAKPVPVPPTVTVRVCADYSQRQDVFADTGESALQPGFRPRQVQTLDVVNVHYPDSSGWRVAYAYPAKKVLETC